MMKLRPRISMIRSSLKHPQFQRAGLAIFIQLRGVLSLDPCYLIQLLIWYCGGGISPLSILKIYLVYSQNYSFLLTGGFIIYQSPSFSSSQTIRLTALGTPLMPFILNCSCASEEQAISTIDWKICQRIAYQGTQSHWGLPELFSSLTTGTDYYLTMLRSMAFSSMGITGSFCESSSCLCGGGGEKMILWVGNLMVTAFYVTQPIVVKLDLIKVLIYRANLQI